jgi:hypothetical protein
MAIIIVVVALPFRSNQSSAYLGPTTWKHGATTPTTSWATRRRAYDPAVDNDLIVPHTRIHERRTRMRDPKTACKKFQTGVTYCEQKQHTVFLMPHRRTKIGTHHENTRYERCGAFANQFTWSRVILNSFVVELAMAPNHTQFIPLTIFKSTWPGGAAFSPRLSCKETHEQLPLHPAIASCIDDTVPEARSRIFGRGARPQAPSSASPPSPLRQ